MECNPDNGLVRWGVKRGGNHLDWFHGTKKRSRSNLDYYCYSITIDGRAYKVSRIIWFYVKGVWPSVELDHHDGNSLNNKFNNLREATTQQNNFNAKRRGNNNFVGVKCITNRKLKKKWVARITINNKRIQLGYYYTEEEAGLAFQAMADKYHGDFAYHNREIDTAA